ncbi:LOW QUALITY PROTEIN: hypothetical protein, conserved [Eimeria necatrix]|uniref:Uncharacterized protein n=1 Tax=Eimeria necatrix TaxID=51315 RepID=U6MCN6_9EIME|nr:LOW QUALITY PROTEIN: hypothetical protein, conserved [Eimeria necatrix]CDJ61992.1 hypothetical protein, conserved [Eimeria necatrix]
MDSSSSGNDCCAGRCSVLRNLAAHRAPKEIKAAEGESDVLVLSLQSPNRSPSAWLILVLVLLAQQQRDSLNRSVQQVSMEGARPPFSFWGWHFMDVSQRVTCSSFYCKCKIIHAG